MFFVGDEFQSIYRFRHADVEVFRQRREASAGVLALTENYRSRPEVLAVVNQLFGAEFGGDFAPLVAAGRFEEPLFGPAVEVLVTDKSSYREGDVHWRVAEARHVARRVRELVDAGDATPGDVVLLFAAGTDAERYEEALRSEGLPTHRAAGRGYFGQQQVGDLTMYLRLLVNRYDDEALVSVLASPFVGVSNDALVLLRRAAGRRPLYSGLERELPRELGPRDKRLFEAFLQRYDRLVRLGTSLGLETLCDRIVAEHDYDLAVLARWDGRRRYANLRKLGRLARSYEELRGADIEGFLRFLADQETVGAKELEAVAIEEGADAVRLLTIHSAKGLEFKVVVVADAGRNPEHAAREEILCLPDGRVGFKVVDPSTGRRHAALGFEELREAERVAEEAETRRLYYVAMTRAVDRLIISGAVDPTSQRDARAPLAGFSTGSKPTSRPCPPTVRRSSSATAPACSCARTVAPSSKRARPCRPPTSCRSSCRPTAARLAWPPSCRRSLRSRSRRQRASGGSRIARSRCSSAARIASTPSASSACAPSTRSRRCRGSRVWPPPRSATPSISRSSWGSIPRPPRNTLPGAIRMPPTRTSIASGRSSPRGAGHPSRRAVVGDGVRPELGFAFEHDGVLLHGRFDIFRFEEGRALVVDYKTNRLED